MSATLAWYYCSGQPTQFRIGPSGHGGSEWHELEYVATPHDRQGSPFYMEAEAACVMVRHHLKVGYDEHDKAVQVIYWRNVSYAVPGVTENKHPLFTPDYLKAFDAWREDYLTKNVQL